MRRRQEITVRSSYKNKTIYFGQSDVNTARWNYFKIACVKLNLSNIWNNIFFSTPLILTFLVNNSDEKLRKMIKVWKPKLTDWQNVSIDFPAFIHFVGLFRWINRWKSPKETDLAIRNVVPLHFQICDSGLVPLKCECKALRLAPLNGGRTT